MAEQLEGSAGRTFHKWTTIGAEVLVRITEPLTIGRANRFRGVDNFAVGESADGNKIQVPLPTDALAKILKAQDRIIVGKTTFLIKYVGDKELGGGKNPMKCFTVEAEGLAPKQ